MRNLQLQESRLHRRHEKDQAELTRLQTERRRLAKHPQTKVATPAVTPANGFEFSTVPAPHTIPDSYVAHAAAANAANMERPL